ncbi:glycosyltransferase [Polynucleobacter yangtzensis]|uniref:Rhamnosyltransferase WbbL n=1 Tax=Polynucleobacter yangtzensis TaxID=1743159 RepID=A0ABM8CKV4_9BURK|nr:glycosyltransferase [Polynucleobacter yangtzensis]BDT78445.1 rhamnosyltransferase WbbL [Polynucleobacter yangtzensis]
MFTISVVSHGQLGLVTNLLEDLTPFFHKYSFEVILTLNIPEKINFNVSKYPFNINIIKNSKKMGFGANHNQAFKKATFDNFCVLNPDIRLPEDPFGVLLDYINSNQNSIFAPMVLSSNHQVEDSARTYPTIGILIKKLLSRKVRGSDYKMDSLEVSVDWLAGMFLMLSREAYTRLNGFDERYYMYYEDVDICFRNRLSNYRNYLITNSYVIHDAQRQSRKNLRHMNWHFKSCLLFISRHLIYKNKIGRP